MAPPAPRATARWRSPSGSSRTSASRRWRTCRCVGEPVERLREILDEIAAAGIENVLALRGDPPRGETEWTPHPGGLHYSIELIELISRRTTTSAIGATCFPEVHPEAPDLDARPAFLKEKVDAGRELPDHAALLRQRALLPLRGGGARGRHRPCRSSPGIMPITNFDQIKRFTEMCGATIPPAPFERSWRRGADDPEAVAELGVAYADAPVRGPARARRARHPLLHAQQLAGHARDPRRPARRAPVGPGGRAGLGSRPWRSGSASS